LGPQRVFPPRNIFFFYPLVPQFGEKQNKGGPQKGPKKKWFLALLQPKKRNPQKKPTIWFFFFWGFFCFFLFFLGGCFLNHFLGVPPPHFFFFLWGSCGQPHPGSLFWAKHKRRFRFLCGHHHTPLRRVSKPPLNGPPLNHFSPPGEFGGGCWGLGSKRVGCFIFWGGKKKTQQKTVFFGWVPPKFPRVSFLVPVGCCFLTIPTEKKKGVCGHPKTPPQMKIF